MEMPRSGWRRWTGSMWWLPQEEGRLKVCFRTCSRGDWTAEDNVVLAKNEGVDVLPQ